MACKKKLNLLFKLLHYIRLQGLGYKDIRTDYHEVYGIECGKLGIFFFNYLLIYLLAALGLHCCAWAFSSCGEQGLFFVAVCGLLRAQAQ